MSESEQLGITFLGCHFSGRAECVPIKKRRYLFRCPSPTPIPPPRSSPAHSQEIDKLKMSDCDIAQGSNADSCHGVAADEASADASRQMIDTGVDIDMKKSDVLVTSECFPGMSILADAACNTSSGRDDGSAELGPSAQDLTTHESSLELLSKNESNTSLGRDDGSAELGPSAQDLTTHKSSSELLSKNESNFSLNGLSNVGVNVSSEETGSSTSKVPVENCNASSKEHTSSNIPSDKSIMADICLQEYTEAAGHNPLSKDEGTVTTLQNSSRSDRLHWDLNIPMEEWGFPLNNEVVDPQTNIADGNREESEHAKLNNVMEDAEGNHLQITPEVFKAETEKALPSINIPMEEWGFPLNNEVVDPQTKIADGNCEESEHAKLNNEMEDAEGNHLQSTPEVKAETEKALPSMTQELKYSDKPKCKLVVSNEVEETVSLPEKLMCVDIQNSSDKDLVMDLEPLDHHETNRSDGLSSSYSIEHAPKPSKSTNEDHSQCVSLGSTGSSGASSLHHVAEIAVHKSDKMVPPNLKDESDPNQVGDKNVHPIKIYSPDNTDDQVDNIGGTLSKCKARSSALTSRPSGVGSYDDVQGSYTSDIADNCEILTPKEHLKCNVNSDSLQNGSASQARIQETLGSQLDYDSQYEDGELRESGDPPWEDYDVENTEAELVDYGSDDEDMYSFGDGDHPIDMSEGAVQKNHQIADVAGSYAEPDSCGKSFRKPKVIASRPSNQPFLGPLASADDAAGRVDKKLGRGHEKLKRPTNKVQALSDSVDVSPSVVIYNNEASRDRSPESFKSSIVTGVRGSNTGNNRTGSGMDAEGSEADIFQLRAFRREWQPRSIGQTKNGVSFRNDRQPGNRFRDDEYSESRYVGDWGSVKSFRTGREAHHIRSQNSKTNQGANSLNNTRGIKRRLSPTYHTQREFHQRAPEMVSGKVGSYGRVQSDGDGHDDLTWVQSTDAFSNGADGPMRRNRSPADRNRNVGMHWGTRPAGKFIDRSATVNRGSYIRRYGSRVDDKSRRGRYHEPVSDDFIESSSNYSHPFPSRERSFSPVGKRRDLRANCHSSESPSRPRTRSPYGWQSPEGRNGVDLADRPSLTHRSRSPDFRSQGRIVRARSPHQREGYSKGHMAGHLSTARRPSQHCSSRWEDERVEAGHCREMDYKHHSSVLDPRPHNRIFSNSKTLNIAESQQRMKQIEYSRPMNPGRAPRMDRVHREGPRHEGSNDGKRHGYQYRTVHTPGHHDMDGNSESFHYDQEDDFVTEH